MSLLRSVHAPLRFTAVLLCLLSLFGHLGVVAHQLFEAHVVCSAPGDLIHADDAHEGRPASERAAWQAKPGDDAHDHCWAPTHRDDEGVAVSTTLRVLDHGAPSLAAGARPATATWVASAGVLSFAPKQSPPPLNG